MRILLILLSGLFLGIIFTIVINTFYLSKEDNMELINDTLDQARKVNEA